LADTLDSAVKSFVNKKTLKDISKLPCNYKSILDRLNKLKKDEFQNIIEEQEPPAIALPEPEEINIS